MGLVLLEGLFRYQMRMVLIGISREIEYELRNDLFAHLTRLSARYYQSHRIGDLMSRATNDLSAVRMVLGPGIMYTASTLATFVGTIVLMVRISPRAARRCPWCRCSSSPCWCATSAAASTTASRPCRTQLANMNALVQENLSGARVVRAYAQEAARDGALRGGQPGVPRAATASSSACSAASTRASSS